MPPDLSTASLIESLSRPDAYPHPVDEVQVIQTHISAVFLAGPHVYKVKKPVNLGFLDFSTLSKRRHFCEEEVRLNRRLAAPVYLGVVPVVTTPSGVKVEVDGEVIDWAVKMRHLPEEMTFSHQLQQGKLSSDDLIALGRKLARFHATADAGDHVARFGRWDVVAGNARENFEQSLAQIGVTVSEKVFDRLRTLTEEYLQRFRSLFESRAARGVPRDTHGDLRLEHVYHLPDRRNNGEPTVGDDLVLIDCIEFNERFRYADPVADVAFLVMDLHFHGRRDLARDFADAYFRESGDDEGRTLLPFYVAYRAVVRAKVDGIKATEPEVVEEDRIAAADLARAHWLLALAELEYPDRKPCLVLLTGLPGSGKSTLARGLAERAGFQVIRSDQVRKELAGNQTEIYTPEWSVKTYEECLRQARSALINGERVIVDANFRREEQRRMFLNAAVQSGVPGVLLVCRVRPEVARERLRGRAGDVSDADWAVYQRLVSEWEEPGTVTRPYYRAVETDASPEEVLNQAVTMLRSDGYAE